MHAVIPYVVAALLFGLGVYGVLRRRNAILVLMAVELMLNAVNLVFVTAGATIRAAVPSSTTGLRASSVVRVQRGSVARLRALRDPRPLENQSRPSSHTPQTGMTCGAPSGRTVAHQ